MKRLYQENEYDIRSYSDEELLGILDLNNPTDRELEAKILHYIRKYDSIHSPDGRKFANFFRKIYSHFFEIFEEEDSESISNSASGENVIEGLENSPQDATAPNSNPKPQATAPNNDNAGNSGATNPVQGGTNPVQLISSLDYARGTLNPLLKQTYKRTICIDSQYRDSPRSLSTDFTLNFSETLRDVVSIKLYAIQVPYTWYTIAQNYGSNFIYIKGNSPGINDEKHDFKLTIPPGNYQQATLASAISLAVSNLSSTYTDISFGNTKFTYNAVSCIANFQLDIQNAFNESNYRFYFNGPFYSPIPTNNPNRNKNLGAFLGFNYSSYSTSTAYSYRTITFIDSATSQYRFDTSNNTITVVQYAGPGEYVAGTSTVYQTLSISFPITGFLESELSILNTVNSVLKADSRFVNASATFMDIDGPVPIDNYGNHYYQWNLKLNRMNGYNIPGSKLCLIVPSAATESYSENPIWCGNNSCFAFAESINELNNTVSETNVSTSSFVIGDNVYYTLVCNDPNYKVGDKNNFKAVLQPSFGYSLNDYISEINSTFATLNASILDNGTPVFIPSISTAFVDSTDSKFHMRFDITRFFFTDNYRIDINNTCLSYLLRFSTDTINVDIPLINGSVFTTSSIQQGVYSVVNDNALVFTVYPDSKSVSNPGTNSINHGISPDVSYNVYIPTGIYSGYIELQNAINNAFRSFSDKPNSYPLYNTSININSIGGNKIQNTLTVNIKTQLVQTDYSIVFSDVDDNSWSDNLFLDTSYNLAEYTYSGSTSAEITGNKSVQLDTIDLRQGGAANQFYFSPIDSGVLGSSTLLFTIPPAIYDRTQLFNKMNSLFDENPITAGTRISYIVDRSTNFEYTKIRWNINKVFTTSDYNLVFYDLFSFSSCFLGSSSIRNATWDTTLGWILGFRGLTQYSMIPENVSVNVNSGTSYYFDSLTGTYTTNQFTLDTSTPYRCVATLTADTTVSVNLYNYFMVILDDYNQSHLNDGLVTITPKDNNLSLPSYANRAKYICDPVTGKILNTGSSSGGDGNQLTQNQVYSINQIINAQNTAKGYTNIGVFVKDIFGLIPIKTTGMQPGQIYVELGGTLQNQDRVYFGPVNIHRMAIKLVNDRGDVVDLNGANWSLQLIVEQMYQSTTSNSGDSKK